jgi:transcriptional regulator with XRE-family HTH domain
MVGPNPAACWRGDELMPRGRRPGEQTKVRTKLAAWRVKRGVTQKELAEAVNIPLTSYWRIETGFPPPTIQQLGNLAIALGCQIEDLIEDRWREWSAYGKPPEPEMLWRNRDNV